MLRRIHFILVLCLGSLLLHAAEPKIVDQVIWVIGDEAILLSDVETELLRLRYEKTAVEGDPHCVIPEQIAMQKLFIAQAKLDSVTVSESAIEQQVEGRIRFFCQRIGSVEKVEEYFGKPIDKIREELNRTVGDQLLMQEMQQKIISGSAVSPADVRRYYQTLPQDSIPLIPEQVEVEIISIAPEITPEEETRIKNQLKDIRQKVESGESLFSTMAILYSEDRGSAIQGGELGFMTRGKLVSEFADAAFALYDPKKVSRIVKTEFGYHIIQLIARKNDQVNCRHILLIPKVDSKQRIVTLLRLDSIATAIRSGSITFEEAAMKYSEEEISRQNDGLMLNEKSGGPQFQLQDLPSDVAKVVYRLQEGEISAPFVYTNEQGKERISIVRLRSRTKAHFAKPETDFQVLKSMVSELKSQEALRKWIQQKQQETYILVNPEYRNCEFHYPGWVKTDADTP